jgi:hypothetical protein
MENHYEMPNMKLTDERLQAAFARVAMASTNGPAPLEAYVGNDYLVQAWQAMGVDFETAVQEVQDPLMLYCILRLKPLGLEYVLADRHATTGLKKALIAKNPVVRLGLVHCAQSEKPKRKSGPRPKDGGYLGDMILELDEQGLSNGKIAKIVYPDLNPITGRSRVAAHLNQLRKKRKKALADR